MDRTEGRRVRGRRGLPGEICRNCGGSGVLRTDASGYRTCLECVGQGSLPLYEASGFPPPGQALRQRVWPGRFRGEVSAWTSGAR